MYIQDKTYLKVSLHIIAIWNQQLGSCILKIDISRGCSEIIFVYKNVQQVNGK